MDSSGPALRLERHETISAVDSAEWDAMFAGRGAFPSSGHVLHDRVVKDDMLSPVGVSAEVERARRADPYHLTSTMVAMGTLIAEGNHLYPRDFLIAEGFLRIPIRLSWVRPVDFTGDGEFLAGLSKKARYQPRYDVTVVTGCCDSPNG